MSDDLPENATIKSHMPASLTEWAAVIRDFGVIIGVPVIIAVGMSLYDLQEKALTAQIKANEAQIKAVEAQNASLKETQYDRALTLLKSQKELFEAERANLTKHIEQAKSSDNSARVLELEARLKDVQSKVTAFQSSIQNLDVDYDRSAFMKNVNFRQSDFKGDVNFLEVRFASYVDFHGSLFQGEADFRNTTFSRPPDFRGSKMKGAYFEGANLSGADLSLITYDMATKFPMDCKSPPH